MGLQLIEQADYSDIDILAQMTLEFFGDNLDDIGLECDYDTIFDYYYTIIDGDDSVVFVSRDDGQVTGAIVGSVSRWQFNRNIVVLNELSWFVPERYRGNATAGGRLFAKLRKWGKERGATVMNIASNIRAESERVVEFYERIGARMTDKTFAGRLSQFMQGDAGPTWDQVLGEDFRSKSAGQHFGTLSAAGLQGVDYLIKGLGWTEEQIAKAAEESSKSVDEFARDYAAAKRQVVARNKTK